MGCRYWPPQDWERACCDELRPALKLLIERHGASVSSIVEDLKASFIDIYLVGEIPTAAVQEIQAQLGSNPEVFVERHSLGCRRCWCTISDVKEAPVTAASYRPKRASFLRWLLGG